MLAVARGEKVGGSNPKVSDRLKAVEWLADRGFGKAVEM